MNPKSCRPLGETETRRTFIKKSASAAAAVLAGGHLFRSAAHGQVPSDQPTDAEDPEPVADVPEAPADRLTVAIIGLGSQGHAHLRNVRANSDRTNVVVGAVCDLWEKRREAARQEAELPEERAYADYREVLELDEIDAVFVATTDHWHARIAIDAMKAGKHVYVEKPMTRYLEEAFEVYDTAKRTGCVLQLGTQGASDPKWSKCAEIIRDGGIGPLVLAQASYMRNSGLKGEWNYRIDPDLTPETVDWEKWLGPVPEREFNPDHFFRWRKYYPYCGGIIGDLIPHRLSPMLLATGTVEFPSRVASLGTRRISTDRDVNDNVQILAEFPSGFSFQVIGSTVNEQGLPDMIRGHEATLTIGGNRINLNPERPYADEIDPEAFQIDERASIAAHHRDWFTCIREGGEPLAGPELAVRLQTILALAEMSERLNIMCLFDAETRQITTGEGRRIDPITYGSLPPV